MSQFGSGDVYLQARLLGGIPSYTYKFSPAGGATNITTLIPAASVVRIVATSIVNVKFSSAVTVGAAATDMLLPANSPEYFCIGDVDQRVGATGTADVYVTVMEKVIWSHQAGQETGPNSF